MTRTDPTHMASMTIGVDGKFGTGRTVAKCGLVILDHSVGGWVRHSNLEIHTTCENCLAVVQFEKSGPLDLSSPASVEAWLAT